MTATIANTPPDIDGFARAWRLKFDAARAKATARGRADDSSVCAWCVNAPWANIFWSNYAIMCVHLRDQPNQTKPPTINLPGATHEIIVLALDPNFTPEIDPDPGLHYLTPANFAGQFKVASDAAAEEVVEKIVRRICAGTLNPDTDAMKQWVAIFGDHGLKSHYRLGIIGSINEGVPL